MFLIKSRHYNPPSFTFCATSDEITFVFQDSLCYQPTAKRIAHTDGHQIVSSTFSVSIFGLNTKWQTNKTLLYQFFSMISVRRPAAALQTAATRLRLMKYKFTTCHYSTMLGCQSHAAGTEHHFTHSSCYEQFLYIINSYLDYFHNSQNVIILISFSHRRRLLTSFVRPTGEIHSASITLWSYFWAYMTAPAYTQKYTDQYMSVHRDNI